MPFSGVSWFLGKSFYRQPQAVNLCSPSSHIRSFDINRMPEKAGRSISALKIASALAMGGARRVISGARRQRYVLPKITAGQPLEAPQMTSTDALAAMHLPPETSLAAFGVKVSGMAGNPACLRRARSRCERWYRRRYPVAEFSAARRRRGDRHRRVDRSDRWQYGPFHRWRTGQGGRDHLRHWLSPQICALYLTAYPIRRRVRTMAMVTRPICSDTASTPMHRVSPSWACKIL